MKLHVTFTGTVEVSPKEAQAIRAGNRRVIESSLGYRMESYLGESFLFAGRESLIRSCVTVEDEESKTVEVTA